MGGFRRIASRNCLNCRLGDDFKKQVSQYIDFRLADSRLYCLALAVDVGFGDKIIVHQREMPYTGAQQGFCAPSANSADTEYRNVHG